MTVPTSYDFMLCYVILYPFYLLHYTIYTRMYVLYIVLVMIEQSMWIGFVLLCLLMCLYIRTSAEGKSMLLKTSLNETICKLQCVQNVQLHSLLTTITYCIT
jgi:hypothetical protein